VEVSDREWAGLSEALYRWRVLCAERYGKQVEHNWYEQRAWHNRLLPFYYVMNDWTAL
jgi:hypothetical protein